MRLQAATLCALLLAANVPAGAQTPAGARLIAASTPTEGAEVLGKRPPIAIELTQALAAGYYIVLLDGADVTQLLKADGKRLSFVPVAPLAAGAHKLEIYAQDPQGNSAQGAVAFTVRHSAAFEEVTSTSRLAGKWEHTLAKPDNATAVPDDIYEATLTTDNRARNGGLDLMFAASLAYRDQDLEPPADAAAAPVLGSGVNPVSYLLQTRYTSGSAKSVVEAGTLSLSETEFTLSGLGRRGGRISFDQPHFGATVFSVDSRNLAGFDGFGIGGDAENTIYGATASLKLPAQAELKAIWVGGGEEEDSLGVSGAGGARKGDVVGGLLTTDFFSGAFRTALEADFSSYDSDTADDLGAVKDRAWRAEVNGGFSQYTYKVGYEHLGAEYASIASQGLQSDRAGFRLGASAMFGAGVLTLDGSQFNDNVDDREQLGRTRSTRVGASWSYSGIAWLPLSLGYQKNIQETTREVPGVPPTDLDVDTLSGTLTFVRDALTVGLQGSYSLSDDRTAKDSDTTATSCALTPAYTGSWFSVTGNISFNRNDGATTGVGTDNYLFGLNLRMSVLEDAVTFEAAGSHGIDKADDDSVDRRSTQVDGTLTVALKQLFKGVFEPSVALRVRYASMKSRLDAGADTDEFSLHLTVAAAVPLAF